MNLTSSIYLGLSVVICIAASLILRFENKPTVSYQPRGFAFGVSWSVIYVLAFAFAIVSTFPDFEWENRVPMTVLYGTSFLACAAWAPLYMQKKQKSAFFVLIVAFLLSFLSTSLFPISIKDYRILLLLPPSLLAGWTGVAACLSGSQAKFIPDSTIVLLCVTVFISLFSVVLQNCFILFPVLWALLTQKTFNSDSITSLVLVLIAIPSAATLRFR